MKKINDYKLEPPKEEIYGQCENCCQPIYVGDTYYSSCDYEYCKDCKEAFLHEYETVAK